MSDLILLFLKYSGKPGRLTIPARFFIILPAIVLLASCSSGKKVAGKDAARDAAGEGYAYYGIPPARDSADNVFVDAVKARILGDKEEAFRKYSLFARVNPGNATAHYELSRLWIERNNLGKAMGEIRLALQSDSMNKWMLKQYADLLSYDEQYVAAAAIYGKIASRERAPEEFLSWEALLYQKAGRYDDALAALDKLSLFTGADDEAMLLQRQQLYLSMNNVEAAAGVVRKLMGYYPGESRYALLLAEVYDNNNMKEKASAAYDKAETLFPDDASVQFALVQHYLKNKDMARLEYYMTRAMQNENTGIEERIGLLAPFLQYRSRDTAAYRIAFNLVTKLAEQEPVSVEAASLYGDLLAGDGRLEEAQQQYKRVLRTDSAKFAYWQQVLYLASVRQDNDSLVAYSERAVRNFPDEPMAYYFGGIGYAQLKKNDQAITFLKNAIARQSDRNGNILSEMLVSLGDVYQEERRYSSSDSCYKAALDLQPNNATALNNYSYYLSLRGENLDEAEKMSAKSLKLRPGEATFMDTYGWILYQQGKYKEAREYLSKAITASDGEDPTLWEHLGDVEYRLGNTDEALQHWEKAVSKGGKSDILQQKIKERKLHD